MNPNPLPPLTPGIAHALQALSASNAGNRLRAVISQAQTTTQVQLTTNATQQSIAQRMNIDELAMQIAVETCDEEKTNNQERKNARARLKSQVLSELKPLLRVAFDRMQKNKSEKAALREIELKKSAYARYIAWRLRHGLPFEFTSPSTWLLYSGEVGENGVVNKARSFFKNKITWKAHFFNPKPLDEAKQHARTHKLIEEAIIGVSQSLMAEIEAKLREKKEEAKAIAEDFKALANN